MYFVKVFIKINYAAIISKLENNELPVYEELFSSLKGHNVLNIEYDAFISNGNDGIPPATGPENYKALCDLWGGNMRSFRDYLAYYNNLDVEP